MGLNIGLAVNEDPHLDAWRIYHERKEQAESSVVQERDQKAKRALDLWKNLQRTRNKKRRWELEYEYSRNASEVAYLDSVLHNLRAIRMALGDAPRPSTGNWGSASRTSLRGHISASPPRGNTCGKSSPPKYVGPSRKPWAPAT
ncbi:hypothetical protein [Thermus antranikianii]|uniref:hypothetical protein n=1 Tax=Thermus antranikianii TaxID=88190 RepID=UPI001C76C2D3|nr:hypothetical protein [Thermus antranikianii]QWK20813.1 MAG: hypothetical protein KNN15_06985 [Thermus antranikianii]